MKTKKRSKRDDTDSSSSSSSSSGSDSTKSSDSYDKEKKSNKTKSRKKATKDNVSSVVIDEENVRKKKCKRSRSISSDQDDFKKAKREAEKSKWNSPKEREKQKYDRSPDYNDREKDLKDEGSGSKELKDRHRDDKERRNRYEDKDGYSRDNSKHNRDFQYDRYRNNRNRYNRYNPRHNYDNRGYNRDRDNRNNDNRDNRNNDNRDNRNNDSRDNRNDRGDRYNRYDDRRRYRSNSREQDHDKVRNSRNERFNRRRSRSGSFDHANAKWGKDDSGAKKDNVKTEKEKPNFSLSGKLTEETNTYRGVVIKYSEPPEARKPKRRWRLYPFKGEKAMQTLYIHRESAYLIGRDRKVVDLPVDHPSCSKQHAALQYRLVPFTRDDGSVGKKVRPYLIDLESANGTYINNKKIDPRKYVELLEKDVIKFGYSSREYVLLHENSKDEGMDDDVKAELEEEVVKKEEPDE